MRALGFDESKPNINEILRQNGISQAEVQRSLGRQAGGNPSKAPQQQQQALGSQTKMLLGLDAFQRLMAQRILARDPAEEVNRAFDLFDEGGKGLIGIDDLRRVARELGEGLGEDELNAMIEEFDMNNDGYITREEFMDICMS